MIRARSVTDALTTIGLREVRWLARETGLPRPSGADRQSPDPARLDRLTELVVTATAVLGLPILRDLQPEAMEDPDRDARAQWIQFVLDQAESEAQAHAGRMEA
jgi:hypothetical protein